MKSKVILIAAALTLTCTANSFAAFAWFDTSAAGEVTLGTAGTRPQLKIKPSANVVIGYDTVAATGVAYALGTFHSTGTKSFGTNSTDTNIYYFDNAGATTPIANTKATATKPPDSPTTSSSQVAWPTGWTAAK